MTLAPPPGSADAEGESGIIRVIERDDAVRAMLTGVLVTMGFSVIPCATFQYEEAPVTATLVDVSLLRLTDNWALTYLRFRGPVLFLLSTREDDQWLAAQLGLLPSNVLRKPFAPAELAGSLSELIGVPRDTPPPYPDRAVS